MKSVNKYLFGRDPKIQKAILIAENASQTQAPVLVTGEAGVGKRTLCRFIYENSTRADQIFEIIDCAGNDKNVVNEILGYRDDYDRFHRGVLERANQGTVVFANIDALNEDFQKKFHKILSELSDYDIDIRIIFTTTKNLSKMVGSGRFYRGLYMLTSGNVIHLTPLRERVEDLELLTRHFMREFSEDKEIDIDDVALEKVLNHYWTHNIHELKTVLENSIMNCEENKLTESDLEIGEKEAVHVIREEDNEGIRLMSLKEAERLLIKKALIHTSENRTQAAKILGVSIRTLRNKINEYRDAGNTYFINLR